MNNLSKETIDSLNIEFVILGTDYMAYSLAHIIHKNYDKITTLIGTTAHFASSDSKIVKRVIYPNLRQKDEFVNFLQNYSKKNSDKKLILFPIADIYTQLLIKHEDELRDYFYFTIPTKDNVQKLLAKNNFYAQCEENNIDYPKTQTCDSNINPNDMKLSYPIVLKYDDSAMYMANANKDLAKVYFINNKKELEDTLQEVRKSAYTAPVILQEFIPGEPSKTYSLNVFSDNSKKVRMMALGKVFAYDLDPTRIGNNWAIKTVGDMKVYKKFEKFLNDIEFSGFANFDLKLDPRDGIFKPLEVNIRFPASMGFLDAGGANFVDFYIRDLMNLDYDDEVYYHEGFDKIWLDADPQAILSTIKPDVKKEFLEALKKGYYYSQYYEKDKSLKRWIRHRRHMKKTRKDAKKYNLLPE